MDFERRNADEWNDKTVSPQTLPDRSTPLALGQRTQTRIIAKQNEERIVGRHESGNGTWPFARQALDPQAQSFQSRKHTRTQPRSYANVASGTASQNVNVSRHVQPGSWNRKPAGNPHSASLPRGQTISPKEALSIPQSKASINPSIAVPTTPARQIQNFQSLDISDREKDDSPHKSLADAQEQNKLGTTQDEHMVFRHKPNAAVYLPFSGFVPWPAQDVPLTSLGTEFSRLDKARNDYQCHITFDEETSAFKIYGESLESVSEAAEVIKALLQEALIMDMPPSRTILIDIPQKSLHNRIVMLDTKDSNLSFKAANLPAGKRGRVAGLVQASTGSSLHQHWDQRGSQLAALNVRVLSVALSDVLANVRLHGKRIRLRCILGVFVWHSYWWQPKEAKDLPIIPFVQNSRDQRAQGSIYGVTTDSHLLERIFQSKGLIKPQRTGAETLDDLRPVYEGCFSFEGEKSANAGAVQLTVAATEDRHGHCEIMQKEWADEVRNNEYGLPSELCMVHLQNGLSWSFQTSLCAAPRTIGEGYRWFAQNIKVAHTFRPWSSKSGSTLAFDFPSSLKLRGFIQKTIWHFCLACDSRCTLDVIKADRFDTAAARPGFPTKLLESQWGVEVYHDRWGMLSRGLPRGKPSSLKIDDIFPDSSKANDIDPSLGGFVDTMRQIVDTLYHSQLV